MRGYSEIRLERNAVNALARLLAITNSYLAQEMDVNDYIDEFEVVLFDNEDEIFNKNSNIHSLLDNIRDAGGYFEPEEALRLDDPSYIDENQFREIVQKSYLEIVRNALPPI